LKALLKIANSIRRSKKIHPKRLKSGCITFVFCILSWVNQEFEGVCQNRFRVIALLVKLVFSTIAKLLEMSMTKRQLWSLLYQELAA
jgi:hypothetical protein